MIQVLKLPLLLTCASMEAVRIRQGFKVLILMTASGYMAYQLILQRKISLMESCVAAFQCSDLTASYERSAQIIF